MAKEKIEKTLKNKEVSDALHMLLHCSLKDKEYETQVGQFHIIADYIKELEEKNKNKSNILNNIRDEFLKYDWKNSNPIQTYNQLKSLYESIFLKTDFEKDVWRG